MIEGDPDPSCEQLLANRSFLTALVRSLVPDSDTADDVIQQAWLQALKRPPGADSRVRPWLRTLVLNLMRSRWRRQEVERSAMQLRALEPPEEGSSALDQVQLEELRRIVGEEVLALGEPYREVVLSLFYAGRSTRETAELLGRPLNTVQSQQRRALEQLRTRLEQRLGSMGFGLEWLVLLFPRGSHAPQTTLPARVPLGSKLAILCIPIVFFLILWNPFHAARPSPAPEAEQVPLARSEAIDRPDSRFNDASKLRVQVSDAPPLPSEPVAAGPRLELRVLDQNRDPIVGAFVSLMSHTIAGDPSDAQTDAIGQTDGDGFLACALEERHRIETPFRPGAPMLVFRIEASGYGAFDLNQIPYPDDGTASVVIELSEPGFDLRGRVFDAAGNPIAARVRVGAVRGFVVEDTPERLTVRMAPTIPTDEEGRYEILGLSPGRHPFEVSAPGFVPLVGWLDSRGQPELARSFELGRGNQLVGIALDAQGNSLPRAKVSVEYEASGRETAFIIRQTETDEYGDFQLSGLPDGRAWVWIQDARRPQLVHGEYVTLCGEETFEVIAALEPSKGVRLQLFNAQHEPLAGHAVDLINTGRRWHRQLVTDAKGEALAFGCPVGELRAIVYRSQDEYLTEGIQLQEFAGLQVGAERARLVLDDRALAQTDVSGSIVPADGYSLPSSRIFVRSGDAEQLREVPLQADGSFHLVAPARPTELHFFSESWGFWTLDPVKVSADGPMDLGKIQLPPLGTLAVKCSNEAPAEGTHFRLFTKAIRAATIDEGPLPPRTNYELLPGDYVFEINSSNKGTTSRHGVTVQAMGQMQVKLPN